LLAYTHCTPVLSADHLGSVHVEAFL
jgi:hypothetical protein